MRQVKSPKSQPQAESMTIQEQRGFGRMFLDIPASEIGQNDVAYNENCILHPTHAQGRTGSKLFSPTPLPMLPGRGGFTVSRVGNLVTAVVGTFESMDIYSRYLVWPDGRNDEIIEFISATQVRTRQTGDMAEQSGCYLRGRVVGCFSDKTLKIIIIHIDTRFFYAQWNIDAYREIYPNSYETPSATSIKSYFQKDGDYVYCIDSGGIFKINISASAPYFFKINSPNPTNLINNIIATNRKTFGRRYTYSCSKLIGKYTGSRVGDPDDANIPLNTIELETGTNKLDKDAKDYGEVFTAKKVGLGSETCGVLTCDTAGIGINEDVAAWQAITDGSWTIEMNAEGRQAFVRDFTNIETLDDVRIIIRDAHREYWPSSDVLLEIISTGRARFIITTGEIDGSTISYCAAADVGTDISDVSASGCGIRGTQSSAELDNNTTYTEPSVVGDLKPAYVRDYAPDLPQYHFTHYSIFGSADTGANGTDPTTGIGNDPEQMVWLADHPLMKAFSVYSTGNASPGSVLVAIRGVFVQNDIGDTVLGQDGNTCVIEYLSDINGNKVFTSSSMYAVVDTDMASQSAVIGSSTVLTCSREDDLVTLVSGTRAFRATDVGKPIFWADGDVSWIVEFITPYIVRTMDEGSKVSQGVAIDPTFRKFGDVTTDEFVKSRLKNFLASHRFLEALPEADMGVIVPGFLVVANRTESTIFYSSMRIGKKYQVGYYHPANQFDDKPEDDIQALLQFPDKLAVICSRSTWIVATNNPQSVKIQNTGISISTLPMLKLVDNIGVKHIGTIRAIGVGLYSMITSEPGHRHFDGFKYSENLADKQVMDFLKRLSIFTISEYNDVDGFKIWGAEEQ